MSSELLYTSAPQGLATKSRGFCTVLSSSGMPINLSQKLESLSGYSHLHFPNSADGAKTPVAYSHVKTHVGGQPKSILSRVAAYGLDYTNRLNKVAHHVVPTPAEMKSAGPAWMLNQPDLMRTDWDGVCRTTPHGPQLPDGTLEPLICENWISATGNAGWGGVLAEVWLAKTTKPIWITYTEEQQHLIIPLLIEATALLPEKDRWRATFSTYATNIHNAFECRVRCLIAGTQAARIAAAKGNVINLSKGNQPPKPSPWTEYAASGQYVAGLPFPKAQARNHFSPVDRQKQIAEVIRKQRQKTLLGGAVICLTVLLLACYAGWRSIASRSIASSEQQSSNNTNPAAHAASEPKHQQTHPQHTHREDSKETDENSKVESARPENVEGNDTQQDTHAPVTTNQQPSTGNIGEQSSDPMDTELNASPAKTSSSPTEDSTQPATPERLLALEQNLGTAKDLESYAEALQQYAIAVTDAETKVALEKTLSERTLWQTAMAGNELIDAAKMEDLPIEQVLKRMKEIHATLEKQSTGNPQALAIEKFLELHDSTQKPIKEASFVDFGEMLYARLITIESLADENQGRMFMIAGPNASTESIKTKRNTVNLEVVKDATGTTEERAIKTPLRIREEPRETIEWILKHSPPQDGEFAKQWDKNILELAAQIMQRPRLDKLLKEELVYQVLLRGADHSENLRTGLDPALKLMQTREEQRLTWPNASRFSSAIDQDVREQLEPALRDLYTQQKNSSTQKTFASLAKYNWIGFVWRDEQSKLTIRINCTPTKTGDLYTLRPVSAMGNKLSFNRIGQMSNNMAIVEQPITKAQFGRPVFSWPHREVGNK